MIRKGLLRVPFKVYKRYEIKKERGDEGVIG